LKLANTQKQQNSVSGCRYT